MCGTSTGPEMAKCKLRSAIEVCRRLQMCAAPGIVLADTVTRASRILLASHSAYQEDTIPRTLDTVAAAESSFGRLRGSRVRARSSTVSGCYSPTWRPPGVTEACVWSIENCIRDCVL